MGKNRKSIKEGRKREGNREGKSMLGKKEGEWERLRIEGGRTGTNDRREGEARK